MDILHHISSNDVGLYCVGQSSDIRTKHLWPKLSTSFHTSVVVFQWQQQWRVFSNQRSQVSSRLVHRKPASKWCRCVSYYWPDIHVCGTCYCLRRILHSFTRRDHWKIGHQRRCGRRHIHGKTSASFLFEHRFLNDNERFSHTLLSMVSSQIPLKYS